MRQKDWIAVIALLAMALLMEGIGYSGLAGFALAAGWFLGRVA